MQTNVLTEVPIYRKHWNHTFSRNEVFTFMEAAITKPHGGA